MKPNYQLRNYPNRAEVRTMFKKRANRKMRYQEFKTLVHDDIERHNLNVLKKLMEIKVAEDKEKEVVTPPVAE